MPDLNGARPARGDRLALLVLAVVKGGEWGWLDARVLGSFAAAVVLERLRRSSRRIGTGRRPVAAAPAFVRPRVCRHGPAGIGFYAYLLTNVLLLPYVWGYSIVWAGLALVPGAVVAALVASRLGPLAERYGYLVFVVPGALVWAAAYLWYHQRVGDPPAFRTEWLPGQLLSGLGVGATLPLLASATLAAVPGGRYATASGVVSSARQLGGVLGIAVLVVILGDPSPATVVASLHEGWVLSIVAFLVVAVLALPLGRIHSALEDEEVLDERPPVVLTPNPPAEWAVPASVGSADEAWTSPSWPCSRRCPTRRAHRLERATQVGRAARRRGADPPGRPARLGLRGAHRSARGAGRRHGGARS